MESKYDFYRFVEIIERLRAPGGCPWDRAQTHESLKPALLEEAYEAAEAIDSGKPENMADELGDVLLNIVMHAVIGSEKGEFDIDDVTDSVSRKMIRRHPHIFGEGSAETPDDVSALWDDVKAKERGQSALSESLKSVSKALPSSTRAAKLQKKAAKVFCPEEAASETLESFRKMASSLSENSSQDEFAGVLFVLIRCMTLLKMDPEDILRQKNEKFIKKIENIEKSSCNNPEFLVKYRHAPTDELWL